MKKRLLMFAGVLALCLAFSGCGKKDAAPEQEQEVQDIVEPTKPAENRNLVNMEKVEPKAEEKNVFGTKSETSAAITVINKTGDEISYVYIRRNSEEEEDWGDELIRGAFTLKDGEKATYYHEKAEGTSLFDIRIGYVDEEKSECFFRKLPLNTITEITLCMDGKDDEAIPFARYLRNGSAKEVSTLMEVKKRLGLLDEDEEDVDMEEKDDTETSGNDSDDDSENNQGTPSDNNNENAGDDPEDPYEQISAGVAAAEGCIGKPLSSLIDACGEPNGTTYENEPETGETGYHYYNGFTVSTTVDENGNEIVAGVW